MLIEAIMTRSVVTAEPNHSVHSAANAMRDGRFRHMPVVDDNELVVGIVSDREVATADRHTTIRDIMHTDVISVSPRTPVEIAANLMVDNKIGALPVIDDCSGRLIGIVSQTDLFIILARLLGTDTPSTRLELRLEDLPRQLAQIAEIAQQRHITITSLLTLPRTSDEHPNQRTLVLRIAAMAPGLFVDDLRRAGIIVDVPELQHA